LIPGKGGVACGRMQLIRGLKIANRAMVGLAFMRRVLKEAVAAG